jgi:hypothetical protein
LPVPNLSLFPAQDHALTHARELGDIVNYVVNCTIH